MNNLATTRDTIFLKSVVVLPYQFTTAKVAKHFLFAQANDVRLVLWTISFLIPIFDVEYQYQRNHPIDYCGRGSSVNRISQVPNFLSPQTTNLRSGTKKGDVILPISSLIPMFNPLDITHSFSYAYAPFQHIRFSVQYR